MDYVRQNEIQAAIWSFLKRTSIVFHFAWHGPFVKEKKSAIDKNVSLKQEFYNPFCIQDVRLKNILQSKCNFYSCGNAYLIIGSRCNWGQCCCVFIRFTLWAFIIKSCVTKLKCSFFKLLQKQRDNLDKSKLQH